MEALRFSRLVHCLNIILVVVVLAVPDPHIAVIIGWGTISFVLIVLFAKGLAKPDKTPRYMTLSDAFAALLAGLANIEWANALADAAGQDASASAGVIFFAVSSAVVSLFAVIYSSRAGKGSEAKRP